MAGQGIASATESLTFGELLRRHRTAAGLSQDELAERSGLSAHGISDLERGARQRPYRDTVQRLADGLRLDGPERTALAAAGRRSGRAVATAASKTPGALLPQPLSTLVGRQLELIEVRRLLGQVRLLTLTGPGGSGKTRLALEGAFAVGDTFANGATFVDLAPISDPDLVISAVAQALEVREAARQPLLARVQAALQDQHRLLVLDNFEQVLPAAPMVPELLRSAPRLRVLVTSRAPLRLTGEQEYPVPPLEVPSLRPLPTLDQLAQVPAVALFVQRAQAAHPAFRLTKANAAAVAELCLQLDGLPLALELAAARIKLLPPAAMLARLHHRLGLPTGGRRDQHARHQTLHAAIGWSHDLLNAHEQALFRRLAVFAGGWTLEAAEAVCGEPGARQAEVVDTLGSLVDWNLVQAVEKASGEPRFGMLETIREYGHEQLAASGELDAAQRQHAAFFLARAEQSEPGLSGPDQAKWLSLLAQEQDNFRSALAWVVDKRLETAWRLVAALGDFWYKRGQLEEGRRWFQRALRQPATGLKEGGAYARALTGAAWQAFLLGDYEAQRAYLEESLRVQRGQGDDQAAAELVYGVGMAAGAQGDLSRARAYWEEGLSLHWRLGESRSMALTLQSLGLLALEEGRLDDASAQFNEMQAVTQRLGDVYVLGIVNWSQAQVALARADYPSAAALLAESLQRFVQQDGKVGISQNLRVIGDLAQATGQEELGARLLGASDALAAAIGLTLPPIYRWGRNHLQTTLRARLGDRTYETAYEEGLQVPVEQAVELARATLRSALRAVDCGRRA